MEVTIERILPGGLGLAHSDGKTIMVSLAAPGDRLRVRIDRVKGSVAFASIEEIISPSEHRVEPPCPYFGRCGGCDFQQMTYETQLEAKKEMIRDCLRRIGGVANVPDYQITPAPNQWHYRSRAQWQYDSIRKWLGYFESGSRRVCDVAECAVLVPRLQQTLENLRAEMTGGSLPEEVRYFRTVLGDEGVSVAADRVRSPTVREGRNADNSRGITRTIRGETYRLNAESFFQTNVDLLPQLIDEVMAKSSGDSAIELYCGVGLFTIPLARRFARVTAIEDDAPAAQFARDNIASAGLTRTEIVNSDVAGWLEMTSSHAAVPGAIDFLLLDPPRTGAESRVVVGILELRPKRMCYVSCDPATLARDLKKLLAGGYHLDRLAAFDMFPQTHHVETVVHLAESQLSCDAAS